MVSSSAFVVSVVFGQHWLSVCWFLCLNVVSGAVWCANKVRVQAVPVVMRYDGYGVGYLDPAATGPDVSRHTERTNV